MSQKKDTEPKKNEDVLEAYPTRLYVNALPDRRFFRMTRTLTIVNALSVCLLIVLACFFYYTMDHQDTEIRYSNQHYALYRLDPSSKTLRQIAPDHIQYSPLRALAEETLRKYIYLRHSVVIETPEMEKRMSSGLLKFVSLTQDFPVVVREIQQNIETLKKDGRIRDVHIYDLKHVYQNLWTATIDMFDIPVDRDTLDSFCPCQDNSKTCLNCKRHYTEKPTRTNRQAHQRFKMWARVGRSNKQTWENPFGFSINSYILHSEPILPTNAFWGLPSSLQPEL